MCINTLTCDSITLFLIVDLNGNALQRMNHAVICLHWLTRCTRVSALFNLISEKTTLRLWLKIVPPGLNGAVHTPQPADVFTHTHTGTNPLIRNERKCLSPGHCILLWTNTFWDICSLSDLRLHEQEMIYCPQCIPWKSNLYFCVNAGCKLWQGLI